MTRYRTIFADGTSYPYRVIDPNGNEFMTNKRGEGLFTCNSRGEVRQSRGTGQFSINITPAGNWRRDFIRQVKRFQNI